jgi:1-acyl-sn-glycerol-3-phosphate acyltransferase
VIPGVDLIYRRAGVITVMHKSARPRFLNIFKPLFRDVLSPIEQRAGIFLPGARLASFRKARSIETRCGCCAADGSASRTRDRVPVVPAGLRFPTVPKGRPFRWQSIEIEIGPPLQPPA